MPALVSDKCSHRMPVALQSEEEGLKVKQEETNEAVQQQAEVGEPTAAGLVVPVQNGEGDSLNLSAGFIQVLIMLQSYLAHP